MEGNKRDVFEVFIRDELEREAEEIRRENEVEGKKMPEALKAEIRSNLDERIEMLKLERKYPNLSADELRALRVAHKILDREKEEGAERIGDVENGSVGSGDIIGMVDSGSARETKGRRAARGRKRGFRFYTGLAAVVALVAAIGVTGLGGAERVVRFMESVVGGREVQQVDSSDENMVIVEEDVEKAYQALKEEFGIAPVRLVMGSMEGMSFEGMEYDKISQFAELSYLYNEKNVTFFISAAYKDSSLGMDVDEHIRNEYVLKNENCDITIKEYKTTDQKNNRYSANFRYNGLEYFLVGTMKKEKFEFILKNLYFW
ncbi:DUF4367 domain-containing protein [Lachnospiraceae bacterium 48-42]